jgi:hypothetical protein
MDDILPNVWVKSDTDPAIFLDRIQLIADESGQYRAERTTHAGNLIEGYKRVDLYPAIATEHQRLILQFVSDADSGANIRIEVRAHRWSPDPPTYETYVQAAEQLARPLLQEYNRRFQSRRRLSIQSESAVEPRLAPSVRPLFDSFVQCANTQMLHPNDWDRFYRFVKACHKHHVSLNATDLARLFTREGFDEDYACRIASVYDHGRRLLRV